MAILKIKELNGNTVIVDCGIKYPQTFKVDEDYEEPTIILGDDRIFKDSFGVCYSVDFRHRYDPFYDMDHMLYYSPSTNDIPDRIEIKNGDNWNKCVEETLRSHNWTCNHDTIKDNKGNIRWKGGNALYFPKCQICGKSYSEDNDTTILLSSPICEECLSQDDLVIKIKEVRNQYDSEIF